MKIEKRCNKNKNKMKKFNNKECYKKLYFIKIENQKNQRNKDFKKVFISKFSD